MFPRRRRSVLKEAPTRRLATAAVSCENLLKSSPKIFAVSNELRSVMQEVKELYLTSYNVCVLHWIFFLFFPQPIGSILVLPCNYSIYKDMQCILMSNVLAVLAVQLAYNGPKMLPPLWAQPWIQDETFRYSVLLWYVLLSSNIFQLLKRRRGEGKGGGNGRHLNPPCHDLSLDTCTQTTVSPLQFSSRVLLSFFSLSPQATPFRQSVARDSQYWDGRL